MPTTTPSVHLQEDDLVALLAHGITPRNLVLMEPPEEPQDNNLKPKVYPPGTEPYNLGENID